MSVDNIEHLLGARMKSQAAELDRVFRPAPPLRMLLATPAAASGRLRGVARLGLGLGIALAAALTLVFLSGGMLLGSLPHVQPLATISAAPVTSVAPSQSPDAAPATRASPTASPSAPLAVGLLELSR
jgi:hypothetical protein